MFLPFELYCVVVEAAFTLLIGTIALSAGIVVLLLASGRLLPVSHPIGVSGGTVVAVRPGKVSVAQLTAVLAGLGCVAVGMFLWTQ